MVMIVAMSGMGSYLEVIDYEMGSQHLTRSKRPAYSVLDTSLFTQRSGYEPIPWQQSLKRFMDTI